MRSGRADAHSRTRADSSHAQLRRYILSDHLRSGLEGTSFAPAIPEGKPLPRLLADAAAFTDGCAKHQNKKLLASLSTDNVARDIEQVRAALGEDRIMYYGLSYGTVVGLLYATLFLHRVRRMVLDAPVDTNQWFGNSLPSRTMSPWPANGPSTPGSRPAAPKGPQCAKGDATPGGELDGAMALETTRALAGDQSTWPLLTSAPLTAQRPRA